MDILPMLSVLRIPKFGILIMEYGSGSDVASDKTLIDVAKHGSECKIINRKKEINSNNFFIEIILLMIDIIIEHLSGING